MQLNITTPQENKQRLGITKRLTKLFRHPKSPSTHAVISSILPVLVVVWNICKSKPIDVAQGQASASRSPPPNTIKLSGPIASIQVGEVPPVTAVKTREGLRSLARQALPVLDCFASVAEAVPLLGTTVKGPIDAIVKILKGLEQYHQNKDDIQQLLLHLEALKSLLEDSGADSADWIVRSLYDQEADLRKLQGNSHLDYQGVKDGIAQCDREIQQLLRMFSAIGHFKTQVLVTDGLAALKQTSAEQSEQMDRLIHMLGIIISGQPSSWQAPVSLFIVRIWVIDPFGTQHRFDQVPTTFEDIAWELLGRYSRDPSRGPKLKRYLVSGSFELSRWKDGGHTITPITEGELGDLDSESSIVVSVVTHVKQERAGYIQCPLCKNRIRLKTTTRAFCLHCDKNVQVSTERVPEEEGEGGDPARDSEVAMDDLAQLRQIVVRPDLAKPESTFLLDEASTERPNSNSDLAGSTLPALDDSNLGQKVEGEQTRSSDLPELPKRRHLDALSLPSTTGAITPPSRAFEVPMPAAHRPQLALSAGNEHGLLVWDLSLSLQALSESLPKYTTMDVITQPAAAPTLCLLEISFPPKRPRWRISIRSLAVDPSQPPGASERCLTVADVIRGLHANLLKPVTEHEFKQESKGRQARITHAFRQRVNRAGKREDREVALKKGLRRIDFLEGEDMFMGFEPASDGVGHHWRLLTGVVPNRG